MVKARKPHRRDFKLCALITLAIANNAANEKWGNVAAKYLECFFLWKVFLLSRGEAGVWKTHVESWTQLFTAWTNHLTSGKSEIYSVFCGKQSSFYSAITDQLLVEMHNQLHGLMCLLLFCGNMKLHYFILCKRSSFGDLLAADLHFKLQEMTSAHLMIKMKLWEILLRNWVTEAKPE